jgi:rod shape-determining protein MreD
MNSTVTSQTGRLLRALVPGLITLMLVVLTVVPMGLEYFATITPAFVMMSVYYWSLYRPDLMPAVGVFVAGVLLDILSGGPIGLSSLVFLMVQGICVSQRRYIVGKPFLVEWTGFLIVATGAAFVGWLAACMYYSAVISATPFAVQLIISVGIYPLLARFFGRSEQIFLKAS